jgi:type I restriction enzyme M protein
MAVKKSELYSLLWQSCDALRGGMDASQYKDYVLVLLFIKYVSDKFAGQPSQPITIPEGATFADMVALKGRNDIGEQINRQIIAPLVARNSQLSRSDFPDFNDAAKLGTGKEMVDRLSDLIGIFENKGLEFSRNRADGDDILGDAYEYLMQHFATESGKSKGEFYTPAEVSRVIAEVLGIRHRAASVASTVYDPTCGSGSLLLKVAGSAIAKATLHGQERDAATTGLARMNMILHGHPDAQVVRGNTLVDPKFRDGSAGEERLRTFDFVVANPPFSDKRWATGLDPLQDRWGRFDEFGVPPARQGDYAYLLHIVRSLKSTGRGACILPHGVLFRGNAEGEIRRALVRAGLFEALIGLPPNLFYGTGIPACIVLLDKAGAAARVASGAGIFMVDASHGFTKAGTKNRLRERDIHRIVDTLSHRLEIPRFSRQVTIGEIESHEFNLNLALYVDSHIPEEEQDIAGHLYGGIPADAITGDGSPLAPYWRVCPRLARDLFGPRRPGYLDLVVEKDEIQATIHGHPEFQAFVARMRAHFAAWRARSIARLESLCAGCDPKREIAELSADLLARFAASTLIDPYDVYQQLMDYGSSTLQDDLYQISADGWRAIPHPSISNHKPGRRREKGEWACELVPKALVAKHFHAAELAVLQDLRTELQRLGARRSELEADHGGEEEALGSLERISTLGIKERLREIESSTASGSAPDEEGKILEAWLALAEGESSLRRRLRDGEAALDALLLAHYGEMGEAEVCALVVHDKWLAAIDAAVLGEIDRVGERLAARVLALVERYEMPLSELDALVAEQVARVQQHFGAMGLAPG